MENNALALQEIQKEASEFGIEPGKVANLLGNLPQIQDERLELMAQYEQVVRMDIDDPKTSEIAKKLRIRIRDNRTKGIMVWHKSTKEYFLKGGQFVDAIKTKEVAVNTRMEENLEQIENYLILKKQKELEELRMKRKEELMPYMEFVPPIDLGMLSDEDYAKVLTGAKLQFEHHQAQEAQRQAEALRLQKIEELRKHRMSQVVVLGLFSHFSFANGDRNVGELSEEEYQATLTAAKKEKHEEEMEKERIRIENERLVQEAKQRELELQRQRAEAEQKERELQLERERQAAKERAILAEQERIKAENEAAMRKAAEEARQRELQLQAQLRKEQEEKDRIQRELQAREQEELKKIADEENRKKRLSDYEKMLEVSGGIRKLLNTMPSPEAIKSQKGREMLQNVSSHLEKLIGYIENNLN